MKNYAVGLIFPIFLLSCGGSEQSSPISTPVVAIIEQLTINAIAGDQLQLSAAKSQGDGMLNYQWQLLAKPSNSQLSLADQTNKELRFIADVPGRYHISLTVTNRDGTSSSTQAFDVAVNQAPVIHSQLSSAFNTVLLGETLRIDAQNSKDPEQRSLSYHWQIVSQPTSSNLLGASGYFFDFTPTVLGNYQIQLAVSDGFNTATALYEFDSISARTLLLPDRQSALSALQQVSAVFGTGSTDLPETHAAEHLLLDTDSDIGDHFVFELHLEEDGDRDIPLAETDRQRSEIKTYANSDASLVCQQGEEMSLAWQFKAEDIGLSYSFSHLFQIKGKHPHPLLTLTARRISNTQNVLRVLHGTEDSILAEIDWHQVKERWLSASLRFSCKHQGFLAFTIIDAITNSPLITIDLPEIDLWQGIEHDQLGFKFGLYRRVKLHATDEQFRDGLHSLVDTVRLGAVRIEKH